MIKEIVEFMDANEGIEDYFSANYEKTFLIIDNRNIRIIDVDRGYAEEYKLNNDLNLLESEEVNLKEVDKFIKYSTAIPNKQLNKNKGSGGANPYIHTFIYRVDSILYNEIQFIVGLQDKKKIQIDKVYSRVEYQFQSAIDKRFYKKVKDREFLQVVYDESKNILNEVLKNKLLIYFLKNKLNSKILENKKAKDIVNQIVLVFNHPKHIKSFYDAYLKKKTFNKELENLKKQCKSNDFQKGGCPICKKKRVLSSPSELTNYDANKGAFIKKITIGIEHNIKICRTCSLTLNRYRFLIYNRLTNPLPLFIDNKSLFVKSIALIDENEKRKKYRDVLKSMYYRNPKDLNNFYLLYQNVAGNQKNIQIKDLDYVENFRYMTTFKIENFLKIKNGFILNDFYNRELSIFQFEKIINELIFQKNLQRHYFSDYKDIKITYWKIDSANSNSILKNYLIKYRQNFYDYIFKSHQSALNLIDFREMLLDIIIDDIRHDDKNKDGYSIYENEIKEKLNLLFSLNQKKETKLDSGEFIKLKTKMRNSLGYWQDSLELKEDGKTFKKEFIGGIEVIEDDDRLYAFLCGQLARFLIGKKKGKDENKSHADFSGFTEWQTSKLLKEYMWEIHRKYAHELKFDRKYDNAMSMVMTYRDDLEIEDVMEYMIAGYFSDNQIKYQDNIEDSEDE